MFERILYTGLWVVILAIIGVGGWYAYKNLNHDFVYESETFATADQDTIDVDFDDNVEPVIGDTETEDGDTTNTEDQSEDSSSSTATTPAEYTDLVDRLERLIEDNINMKVGSRGTRVGTVQEFLNIFHDTTATVDNDFGNGTKSSVMEFQSAVGITADGEPGPQTYQEMIDWLQNQ